MTAATVRGSWQRWARRTAWTGWTLRRRIVGVVVLLLVTAAVVSGVASTIALRSSLVAQVDTALKASSDRSVGAEWRRERPPRDDDGTTGMGGADGMGPPPALDALGQGAGTVTLTERDGTVTAGRIGEDGTAEDLTAEQRETLLAVTPGAEPASVDLGDVGAYRVLATTTPAGDLVVTGLSLEDVTATVREFVLVQLLVAALVVAAGVGAGLVLVRRELSPLERVARTARRVSELPLASGEVAPVERVPDRDTDPRTEVGQVGASLNRLLGHVEAALAARHESETQVRQFVADASHELRTPLASIRGYAELVRRMQADVPDDALHAVGRVESEARRMTTLVEDMLLLARLDAGRDLEHAPVDITMLALDAVADARAAGPDHEWLLDLPVPLEDETGDAVQPDGTVEPDDLDAIGDAVVVGDEDRLRQVVLNLLTNARVHTPAGTSVTLGVHRANDDVVVTVADDGPGVPETLRPHLFQRFTRGDAARSPQHGSTGLGLAIVDAVVRAHGGTVDVSAGPGATFTVRLPAAPAAVP